MITLVLGLKILIAVSLFFVWVIRYENIVMEFQEYKFPNWFRDFMGIIKLSCASFLISGQSALILTAGGILTILMSAAFFTHIRAKHKPIQMLPSFSLMCASIFISYYSLYLG